MKLPRTLSSRKQAFNGRYLDEFTYRFNGRNEDLLFQNTIKNLVNGKTLTFEKLTKTA